MNNKEQRQPDSKKNHLPAEAEKPIILIIGVGGGGSNAVNYMYRQSRQEQDVAFAIVNTDAQALKSSPVPHKIQIGPELTHGLGAGSNPEVGKQAALESKEEIKKLFKPYIKMVFVTVGEGGGTGTGAAPIIAEMAKEMDKLTIGIVTHPFIFEGKKRQERAQLGTQKLRETCDTVLIILNERLKQLMGSKTISSAFFAADNVLNTIANSVTKIISKHGYVNVDFEDVRTVLKDAGMSVIGTATASGQRRSLIAAERALNSQLMDNKSIHTAEKILLSILSGPKAELQMDELVQITNYIQNQSGNNAEVIFGHGYHDDLGDQISVTIIATGFAKQGGYDKRGTNRFVHRRSLGENQGLKPRGIIDQNDLPKERYDLKETGGGYESLSKNQPTSYRTKEAYYKNLGKSFINSRKEGERYHLTNEEIHEKIRVPAYSRKGISLVYNAPPAPSLISYNLYDDLPNLPTSEEVEG